MDLVMLFNRSIDRDKFRVFLQEIRDRYPFDDIALYMDNLRVHSSA